MLELLGNAHAQTATSTATEGVDPAPYELSPQKMLSDTFGFLFFLFVIFYFFLIRPQQKRFKAHKAMIGSVQKGSRVVTGGGILGTVTKMEGDDIVVVEIAQGVKVKVAKGTISEVIENSSASVGETANDN